MLLDDGRPRVRRLFFEFREANLFHDPGADRSEIHELDRVVELEAVKSFMCEAKARGEIAERTVAEALGVHLQRELIALTEITNVGFVVQSVLLLRDPLFAQPSARLSPQPRERVANLARIG